MLQNIGIKKAWTWYAIHSTHQQNGNEPNARKKPFPQKMNATVLIDIGVVTKPKFRYSIVKFLLV